MGDQREWMKRLDLADRQWYEAQEKAARESPEWIKDALDTLAT